MERVDRWILLVSVMALGCASPVLAAMGDIWVESRVGGTAPSGEFVHVVQPGPYAGLSLTQFQEYHLGVGVDLAYHAWGNNADALGPLARFLGHDASFTVEGFQFTGHVVYDLHTNTPVRPFFSAGWGLYVLRSTLEIRSERAHGTEWRPGFVFGTGTHLLLSPTLAVGLAGQFHAVVASGEEPIQFVTLGVSLLGIRPAGHPPRP